MSVLSTQQIYLDKSAVESHRRMLAAATGRTTRQDGTLITKAQYDAAYYGELGLDILTKCKTPLHFRLEDGTFRIDLSNILSRVKGSSSGKHEGKSNITTTNSRVFGLFSDCDREIVLASRARGKEDCMEIKFTESVSRPNSIFDVLNRLEAGGSTEMMTSCAKYSLMDRMSMRDSFTFGCINMYMWLQKCILYYSTDNVRSERARMDVEVLRFDTTFIQTACVHNEAVIDVDALSDDELMILLIALEGHENVIVVDEASNNQDIFSNILCEKIHYRLCTRKKYGGEYRIPFTLMAPEVALGLITTLCTKLGCLTDWLNTPDYVRGLAMFNQLTHGIGDDDGGKNFVISAPGDKLYGTIFGAVCNSSLNDRVEHTNLAASSLSLILECLQGQAFVNNFHYIAESLGVFNKKLFGVDPSTAPLYISLMVELGLFKEEMHSRMVRSVFCQGKNTGLYGDVRFFKRVFEGYVRMYHDNVNMCNDHVWLQLNVMYGKVFENNSSSMLGWSVPIDASSVGPMVSNSERMERICEWMMMHGLTNREVIAGGMSNVGSRPMSAVDPSIYTNSATMNGMYSCTYSQIGIHPQPAPRSGYDSNQQNSLYYTIHYFCFGKNKGSGDAYVPPHIRRTNGDQQVDIDAGRERVNDIKREASNAVKAISIKNVRVRSRNEVGTFDESMMSNPSKRNTYVKDNPKSLTNAMNMKMGVKKVIGATSLYDLDRTRSNVENNSDSSGSIKDAGVLKDLSHRISDEDEVEDDDPIAVNGFNVHKSAPDGRCAHHTLTHYHESMPGGDVTGLEKLMDETGFGSINEWSSPGSLAAMNQLLGHRTVVVDKDHNHVTVTKIKEPKGTCYVRYHNGHFDLLNPKEDMAVSDLVEMAAENRKYQNVVPDDIDKGVAIKYSELLSLNGLVNTAMPCKGAESNAQISFSDKLVDVDKRTLDWYDVVGYDIPKNDTRVEDMLETIRITARDHGIEPNDNNMAPFKDKTLRHKAIISIGRTGRLPKEILNTMKECDD